MCVDCRLSSKTAFPPYMPSAYTVLTLRMHCKTRHSETSGIKMEWKCVTSEESTAIPAGRRHCCARFVGPFLHHVSTMRPYNVCMMKDEWKGSRYNTLFLYSSIAPSQTSSTRLYLFFIRCLRLTHSPRYGVCVYFLFPVYRVNFSRFSIRWEWAGVCVFARH